MRRAPLVSLLAAATLAGLHAWHLSSVMPERVASHFDGAGRPNAWMSRDAFVRSYLGLVALLTVIFLITTLATARIPDRFVNLPNKSYWLAPERRASTLAWISTWAGAMGTATLLFVMVVMRQVERFNVGGSPSLDVTPLLIGFVTVVTGMGIGMVVKFAKKPPA
jgi:hypothetical protein